VDKFKSLRPLYYHDAKEIKLLKLWGRVSSSNVQVVRWCLHELDIQHEQIDAGFTYGLVDTDEYLQMNPNGTVPTIQDTDQHPLFESSAILRYLGSRYGNEYFWPSDPCARAQIDMWAEWSKINVALNFTGPLFWPLVRMPVSKRQPDQIADALKMLEKYLSIADERLAHTSYLTSEHLTLADIQLGHVLYRYYEIDLERAQLNNLRRYYEHLSQRPAYRSSVMVSFEELRHSM